MPPGRTWRKRKTLLKSKSNCVNVSNEDVYVTLLQWMKRKGFVNLHLRPAICPDTGRGLMSTRKIEAGETLVSVPKVLIITTQMVLATSYLASYIKNAKCKISPRQCLALFLMCERGLAENSLWSPYINSLPTTFCMLSDVQDKDSNSSFPKRLQRKVLEMKSKMEKDFMQLKPLISHIRHDIVQLGKDEYFSFDRFSWAWNCINTRCVYMMQPFCPYLNEEKDYYALVPFLDLLNHSPIAKVCARFNVANCCYEVTTEVALEGCRQVFINYGNHDNETLLLQYGFIASGNPNTVLHVTLDEILRTIQTKNGDEDNITYEKKIAAVRNLSLHKDLSFSRGGPSWCLLAVVAFLLDDDIRDRRAEESLRNFLDQHGATTSCETVAILYRVISGRLLAIESKIILLLGKHMWMDDAARTLLEDYKAATLSAMNHLQFDSRASM